MPGKPAVDRPLCRSTTHRGTPCRLRAMKGSAYCNVHGGSKAKLGAPTKLDEAITVRLEEAVKRGVAWKVAAQAAGINYQTLLGWRAKGRDDLEAGKATPFAALVDRLTRAEAEAEDHLVNVIRKAAVTDWRAGAWLLERRAPERWARRDGMVAPEDVGGKPREVVPERKDEVLAVLAQAMAAPPERAG